MSGLKILYNSDKTPDYPFFSFWEQTLEPGFVDKALNFSVYLKLVRIVRGACEWTIYGRRYELRAGDYAVLNNVESRAFTKIYGPEALFIEQAVFLPTSLYPHLCCLDFFYGHRNGRTRVISQASPCYHELDGCFRLISDEVRSASPYRDDMISALFGRLIALCARSAVLSGEQDAGADREDADFKVISNALQYIHTKLSEDMCVGSLAKRFGFSKSGFNKAFVRYTGVSPAKYIRLARIQNTLLLMKRDRINVLDAALESGFNSNSGFYKTFRAITGMSPKEYMSESGV